MALILGAPYIIKPMVLMRETLFSKIDLNLAKGNEISLYLNPVLKISLSYRGKKSEYTFFR